MNQGRIQKLNMVGKSMWMSVNLINFQRNFMRLTLLHIPLPTPESDPDSVKPLMATKSPICLADSIFGCNYVKNKLRCI